MGDVGELLLAAIVLLILAYYKIPGLKEWARGVKRSPESEAPVMSRPDPAPAPSAPVVLGRTETEARTDAPTWTRDDQKALYTLLRRYGVKREELRPLLKPFGVPLSNDVWADSAPDEADIVTPYAGRRTKAAYYPEEPELEFKGPPV